MKEKGHLFRLRIILIETVVTLIGIAKIFILFTYANN